MISHLVIPDAQVKPGVPMDHIIAAGNMIVDRKPDVIVVIGDWWDFPSLGTHSDRGNVYYHNKDYMSDFFAGVEAMELLLAPMIEYNIRQAANKKKQYKPRLVFTMGNHEDRRDRLVADVPKLAGSLRDPREYLAAREFEVHEYKRRVIIEGISYCHLCPQPSSAGAISRAHLIAGKRHSSWVVGHTQTLDYHVSALTPRIQCIIAGAFYLHDEDYKAGTNDHWRGLVYLHDVHMGTFSPEFLSIETLLKRY